MGIMSLCYNIVSITIICKEHYIFLRALTRFADIEHTGQTQICPVVVNSLVTSLTGLTAEPGCTFVPCQCFAT